MYHNDSKSFLLFGKQMNQIIAILQMVSDKNPDIQKLNEFIQYLKDMVPYEDMLNSFVFGDQETMPDEVRPVGSKDAMTLEEMMDDLQLRFMDKRNGKN
mgnify:FL=1|jgi:hypothetical protein|tara:strand:- start:305 stop:601 length:297 start_codon:yes stop_codon:yes gene_type:complete